MNTIPPRLILLCLMIMLTGCSSLPSGKLWTSATKSIESAKSPVVEILAVWQPGEGRDTNGVPTRGFAGQIYFFGQGNKTPVEVKGNLKVYVFDDWGTTEEQSKPIHIFEFNGGSLAGYHHDTKLGHGYQLFLPYTRKGAHEAKCTLRLKYTSEFSGDLLSKESTIVLTGKKSHTELAQVNQSNRFEGIKQIVAAKANCENGECRDESISPSGIELMGHEKTSQSLAKDPARRHMEEMTQQDHPLKVMTLSVNGGARSSTQQHQTMNDFSRHMQEAEQQSHTTTPSSLNVHPMKSAGQLSPVSSRHPLSTDRGTTPAVSSEGVEMKTYSLGGTGL